MQSLTDVAVSPLKLKAKLIIKTRQVLSRGISIADEFKTSDRQSITSRH